MRELTYATVCSGVECMGAAVADLPMRPVFFSEIEPFPCAVLKSRYPNVPNLGDMGRIHVSENGKEITNGRTTVTLPDGGLDVFAGGTPCQDVSCAGLRRGMADGSGTRSSLAFEFVRLIGELRPRWLVWENVAGVLSDPNFPGFLAALAERGYGLAYRTLDAQWVRCADIHHPDGRVVRLERAVPQRRRRVWVVGRAGGDVGAASEVLLELDRALGDRPPRRRPGKGTARAPAQGHGMADGVVGATAIAGNVVGRGIGTGGNGVGAKDEEAYTLDTVGGQSVAARGADGFDPYEPGGVKTLNAGVFGTVINGTCPGSHGAVVETVGTYENHAQDGRVGRTETAPTMGASNLNGPSCGNPLVVEGRDATPRTPTAAATCLNRRPSASRAATAQGRGR